ncbi:hypothetical protein [uncultured Haemophilus sp.]|jgi:hypothetical protein|uniref:hypothetical protein n=1 Tax=uncultured Haemophilus sp. TaxID=237779 RepID=UPI00204CBEE2|nr:hypothetical protein [uncultured Haemophilus sp.]DAI54561.1 MAG TPA: hypothetical protein [Bacteriophage sp.]
MEQTNPSDNINKGFAYNVAKDIANLEMAVESLKDAPKPSAELAQPQPDVIPEGLEVIKFEVPKLFEQHVLNKLRESGKEVRLKIELPESFKNSTCLYVAEGSYPKLIDVGQEYSEVTGGEVRRCTLIKLMSTSNVKSTNATPIIDDNYALAQKIAESKVNEGLFVKWLAKYVTETYLADKQKENQYLYVRNDPSDVDDFIRAPYYNVYQYQAIDYDIDDLQNDLRDKKAKLESGEIDPSTAKDFVIPAYPQV